MRNFLMLAAVAAVFVSVATVGIWNSSIAATVSAEGGEEPARDQRVQDLIDKMEDNTDEDYSDNLVLVELDPPAD